MRFETRTWTRHSPAGSTSLTAKLAYLAELVEACPHCGIPCSGTVLFWVEENAVRLTIEVDRPIVDAMMSALWPVDVYEAMPLVFRDHNEARGWCEAGATFEGTPYPRDDLGALLTRWRQKTADVDRAATIIDALEQLVEPARALSGPVWIFKD